MIFYLFIYLLMIKQKISNFWLLHYKLKMKKKEKKKYHYLFIQLLNRKTRDRYQR